MLFWISLVYVSDISARNQESGQRTRCARQSNYYQSTVTAASQNILLRSNWPSKTIVLWTILFSLKSDQESQFSKKLGPRIGILIDACRFVDLAFSTVRYFATTCAIGGTVRCPSKATFLRKTYNSEQYNQNLWQKTSYEGPGWT